MEVIIIDSISHQWENLIEYHSGMQGNSFTNWSKITPRHNGFIQQVLQSPCHIISTLRTKTDYILNDKNGKLVPEKVGLKSVQRDGLEYEWTLAFELDMKNHATASKDRTGLFFGKPEHRLSVDTGKILYDWCNSGAEITIDAVSQRINHCKSLGELLELYKQHPQFNDVLKPEFETQKRKILICQDASTTLSTQKIAENGIH